MNGISVLETNGPAADRRPIITCSGEVEVFSSIEDAILQALPQDTCEWKRSLGRPLRMVHIGATFTPFSSAALPKANQWDLIRQPLFHVYWTECSDIDAYKNTIKDDIEGWLKELQAKDIQDWLIVVVENFDGKRANKLLPRTTVLDKIRADFAPKQGDRCISVINPGKTESRSADSWRGLISRIRQLLLTAYAKAVTRLEDYVRQERERRNTPGWNFMKYFKLQEELAQVLEMLGLYDEALVQYDELDALFSQLVINGITCDSDNWLLEFQRPLERWHALKLGPSLLTECPSLLELRAYLYAKQAHMLLLTNKVWEMASRCVPFLHTCAREMALLEIPSPPGALTCWLFLGSMEVLQTCDKFNDADAVEDYSLNTASLWEYASHKLLDLGELCGLMPGGTPTSLQLHTVVSLSAGMGDNPGTASSPSPTDKLKEALCSQEIFYKLYLELAELALGTYKHISRLRHARLVGTQLAEFHLRLNEIQKAAAFLMDAVRTYQQDGWSELAALQRAELAQCYRRLGDSQRLVQVCAYVAAEKEADMLIRWTYFDEMHTALESLDSPLIVPFNSILTISSLALKSDPVIMQHGCLDVELVIESNFPREVLADKVLVSMLEDKTASMTNSKTLTNKDLCESDLFLRTLTMLRHLDYKQDGQLERASVVCHQRTGDAKRKVEKETSSGNQFETYVETGSKPLVITPGVNSIMLQKRADTVGKYKLGQVAVHMGKLQLVSSHLVPQLSVEVKDEHPSVKLYKGAAPLLSGIEQTMDLIVTMGSYNVDGESKIKLTASPGLHIATAADSSPSNSLELPIGVCNPLSSQRRKLLVMADLLSKEHSVTIVCPWSSKPMVVQLNFSSPLGASWRLHTVGARKIVQVTITGQAEREMVAERSKLSIQGCETVAYDTESSQVISEGQSCSYLWEIKPAPDLHVPAMRAEFSLVYSLEQSSSNEDKIFRYFFDITDYQTLYFLEASVEPPKGSEFCRVGAVCHLSMTISRTTTEQRDGTIPDKLAQAVMYEVLAEQSMWAVCGRSAGVISFDDTADTQTVSLDVMPVSSGHLPLPLIRMSKYITANNTGDNSIRPESQSRLEPFSVGQVYNKSKGKQVHVIQGTNEAHIT